MRICRIAWLALGGLFRTPLRALLTCLGVTIASGALVSMVGFALGIQANAEAPFEELGLLNNIEVSPKNGENAETSPPLDDAALQQMETLPHVTLAYPEFRLQNVEISHGEKTETSFALGLPRDALRFGPVRELLTAGGPFGLQFKPEAILDEGLVEDLGFASPAEAIGETITLGTSGLARDDEDTFKFERQELTVTVVGVYKSPGMGPRFAFRSIILPVELMKDIPGVDFSSALEALRAGRKAGEYRRVIVRVEHPSNLTEVEKSIKKMGFKTHTLLEDLEQMRTFFVFLDVLLASVGTVALVVAGLGIINTLLMAVLERRQEIGIYKAIGASNGDLVVLFLTEASILGLVGGVGGLGLGRFVSWLIQVAINTYARSQGVEDHLAMFQFPPWLLAATVLFSIIIAVVAGVYPAMRAAKVDPIQALRAK